MITKLYCYVDETGQDTKGKTFLVVVVLEKIDIINVLQSRLKDIEVATNKNILKWTKTPFKVREKYLTELLKIKELRDAIFYAIYQDTKAYTSLTTLTIAKSVLSKTQDDYSVVVIIDGLNDKEMQKVRAELKELKISYKKIRGMKDEQDPILRLADSIAGFLRDGLENQKYTVNILNKFKKMKIITEV